MFRGVDGEGHRGQHEENGRDGGRFGERRSRTPRPEGSLTALSAECRRNISSFAALEQHNNNQKQADENVNNSDEYDHEILEIQLFE